MGFGSMIYVRYFRFPTSFFHLTPILNPHFLSLKYLPFTPSPRPPSKPPRHPARRRLPNATRHLQPRRRPPRARPLAILPHLPTARGSFSPLRNHRLQHRAPSSIPASARIRKGHPQARHGREERAHDLRYGDAAGADGAEICGRGVALFAVLGWSAGIGGRGGGRREVGRKVRGGGMGRSGDTRRIGGRGGVW